MKIIAAVKSDSCYPLWCLKDGWRETLLAHDSPIVRVFQNHYRYYVLQCV